ncbi:MAG TPA: UvrD-helicase domain-containing protein [Ktedonobacteraceae bacterium]|nr:UvrD-helicase domain-containing protein [Ktedonobacteraceae bacterium]
MDISTRLEAVEAARNILQHFRDEHPDWQDDVTPLERIVAWMGCEVATFHPDDYPDGTYGFVEPGERLIWLCRDLPTPLRRFTLAHELGHVALHGHIPFGHDLPALTPMLPAAGSDIAPDEPCHIQDISENVSLSQQQAEELLGPGFIYDPRSQRELAANLFAAELLMPLIRVQDLYLIYHVAPDTLAALFNVSQAAMLNRLAGLLTRQPALTHPVSVPLADDKNASRMQDRPQEVMRVKKFYDEFQQAAIETPTPALVVAGPGSGKTSTLIGRAEYLLQQPGVRPEHILALTFSRKAAQEMQERLQKILPRGLPAPTISTFHAFCAELLRNYASHVGLRQKFELVDDAEGYFLLHSLAETLPLQHYQNLHNPAFPFRNFLKAISRAKDELITPARYRELAHEMQRHADSEDALRAAERAREVAAVYELYQRNLEQRGDSDFGGLIMLAVQLLTEHAEVRAELEQRYRHILVDEFQDINRASGVLLRLLAGEHKRVWVVGDANQAIYGFRGASPANIANFRHDYPNAVVLPLNRNYRSRPDIVSLADTFRRGILEQDPELASVQTARATHSESYITLAIAPDEASELRGLARDIQEKLAEGYTCSEIVVLCRTRALARRVTRVLAQAGLPVNERGGILEQDHIRDLLSLLLLLADSSGMGILRAAHLPAHPLSQEDVEALLLEAKAQKTTLLTLILRAEIPPTLSSAGSQALAQLATILKNLYHSGSSVWALLARYLLLETSMVRDLLTADEQVQARMIAADYARLLQYAYAYDQQRQARQRQAEERAKELGAEPPALPTLEEQVRDFLEYLQVLLSLRQEGESRHEEGEETEGKPNLLRVMTVHASKGLEFPVVYLPGLTQRRFPLPKQPDSMPPPVGMLPPESEGERAHESGESCLFYVGATRARDQLILSYSERYGKQNARRSGYVDALVVGLPDERVRRVIWHGEDGQEVPRSEPVEDQPVFAQPSQAFIEAMQPARLRAGQIEDYQTCPRRYAYSTIYAFQNQDGTFLPFWQATSDTLKALVERATAEDRPASQEQVAELFSSYWRAQGGDNRPFAQLYERHGQEIVARVWDQLQEKQAEAWKLRQNLTVELAGRSIEVSVDRIEVSAQAEQPTKFIRNRFGKGKPSAGTRELLYLHARRQHHAGQEVTLQTHNLSTGERHEIKVTTRKEQSLLSDLEQAVQGIERHDFTPRPDAHTCASCPYFLICPA